MFVTSGWLQLVSRAYAQVRDDGDSPTREPHGFRGSCPPVDPPGSGGGDGSGGNSSTPEGLPGARGSNGRTELGVLRSLLRQGSKILSLSLMRLRHWDSSSFRSIASECAFEESPFRGKRFQRSANRYGRDAAHVDVFPVSNAHFRSTVRRPRFSIVLDIPF